MVKVGVGLEAVDVDCGTEAVVDGTTVPVVLEVGGGGGALEVGGGPGGGPRAFGGGGLCALIKPASKASRQTFIPFLLSKKQSKRKAHVPCNICNVRTPQRSGRSSLDPSGFVPLRQISKLIPLHYNLITTINRDSLQSNYWNGVSLLI